MPLLESKPKHFIGGVPIMFENLIEKLKKNPTTLVFTEGTDA